jgi:hypothetical protein
VRHFQGHQSFETIADQEIRTVRLYLAERTEIERGQVFHAIEWVLQAVYTFRLNAIV